MAILTMREMKAYIRDKVTEDEDFRNRFLTDPRAVISEEFGIFIPEDFDIQVHEDDATTAHFVLPLSPRLTEESLAQIAGGGWLDNASRGLGP